MAGWSFSPRGVAMACDQPACRCSSCSSSSRCASGRSPTMGRHHLGDACVGVKVVDIGSARLDAHSYPTAEPAARKWRGRPRDQACRWADPGPGTGQRDATTPVQAGARKHRSRAPRCTVFLAPPEMSLCPPRVLAGLVTAAASCPGRGPATPLGRQRQPLSSWTMSWLRRHQG